jgi:hypothetical protein
MLLAFVSACAQTASYERETAIEKSLDEFHARMNEEQYQAIYADADPELRNHISEQDFTKRLAEAKERTGKIEGKADVVLKSSVGRKLRQLFPTGRTSRTLKSLNVMPVQSTNGSNGRWLTGQRDYVITNCVRFWSEAKFTSLGTAISE